MNDLYIFELRTNVVNSTINKLFSTRVEQGRRGGSRRYLEIIITPNNFS